MESELFDKTAPSQTIGLSLNSDLYSKVRDAGIDASRVAQDALIRALLLKQRDRLREEIRRDMEAVARYVEEHGDPSAELYNLPGPPDAA